jgi:murein DD-endopeptidase MepM/ murein hydrolase activator NlpD
MSRTAVWAVALGAALAVFVCAIALTAFGRGGSPAASAPTPTPPGIAQATPTRPAASGVPGSPTPEVTPTPEPPGFATDKVGPVHSVGPKELTGYGWPLKRPWITSTFSHRDFGNFIVVDGVSLHDGLDLATHCGDTVYATHDGTVLANDRTFDQELGYEGHPEDIYNRTVRNGHPDFLAIGVVIDDGNGYRSQYLHLKEATVQVGQFVHRGDQIGIEGETGAATGCHVHYSLIRMDGVWDGIVPYLWQFGYPEKIREHVDPKEVLPWGDPWAPLRLYCQVQSCASPSPSPSLSPAPGSPTATPGSPTPTPTGTPTPAPTATPSPSPSPTPAH